MQTVSNMWPIKKNIHCHLKVLTETNERNPWRNSKFGAKPRN